jgi:DNA-binding NtrC family response regulator
MAQVSLLVVAPDPDIRRSITFALEAEGYLVSATDGIAAVPSDGDPRFDCTVLDQLALKGPAQESIAFCTRSHPVVLLAATPLPWVVEWVSQVIATPPSGGELALAVLRAIHPEAGVSRPPTAPTKDCDAPVRASGSDAIAEDRGAAARIVPK